MVPDPVPDQRFRRDVQHVRAGEQIAAAHREERKALTGAGRALGANTVELLWKSHPEEPPMMAAHGALARKHAEDRGPEVSYEAAQEANAQAQAAMHRQGAPLQRDESHVHGASGSVGWDGDSIGSTIARRRACATRPA